MVDLEDRYHAIPKNGVESQHPQPFTSGRWLKVSVALFGASCLFLAFIMALSVSTPALQSSSAPESTSLFGISNFNLKNFPRTIHIPQVAQKPSLVARREMGSPLRGAAYIPAAHNSESAADAEEAGPSDWEVIPGNPEFMSGWEVVPGSMVLPLVPPSKQSQSLGASQDLDVVQPHTSPSEKHTGRLDMARRVLCATPATSVIFNLCSNWFPAAAGGNEYKAVFKGQQ